MKRFIVFPILLIALLILTLTLVPNINTTLAKPAQATAAPILSVAELKYKLLDHFGTTRDSYPGAEGISFCDTYLYPVGRGVDAEIRDAKTLWDEITQNQSTFRTILNYLNLADHTTFTDEDKLAVYRECRKHQGTLLDLSTDPPSFNLNITIRKPDHFEYYAVTGTINWQGELTVLNQQTTGVPMCPICLVEGTVIDTPDGAKPVESLTIGATIWTVDYSGQRIAAKLNRVAKLPSGSNHQVVEMKLADGRSVTASLGHPLTDGTLIGDVRAGDTVDGSQVSQTTLKTYAGSYTYDILVYGTPGFYWANGILLGSTLKFICN